MHLLKKYKVDADERASDVLEGAEKAGRGSAVRLRETIGRMRGRRDDGYHELKMLMAPISLCDYSCWRYRLRSGRSKAS